MRAFPALLTTVALALLCAGDVPATGTGRIWGTAVPLDWNDPGRVRAGALTYLGGWELRSDNGLFGGLSTMLIEPDGSFLAVGDQGTVFRFAMTNGTPAGRVVARVPDGPPTIRKRFGRDIEAMTSDPATGRIWLGYESWMAIWRFDATISRSDAHAMPRPMRRWEPNTSIEAMVRLADGRFLVFCESCRDEEGFGQVILFASDPALPGAHWWRLRYRLPTGFRVTDARVMPDGRRVMILHRSFAVYRGFGALLGVVPIDAFRPGATIFPRAVARLEPPLAIDNMEALAMSRERDRTIVWIASDDNFLPLERSLLMKFAFDEGEPRADTRTPPGTGPDGVSSSR